MNAFIEKWANMPSSVGKSETEPNVAERAPINTTGKGAEASEADLEPEATALSLKGHAVELWCDHAGKRFFIVADEEDAQEAMKRFGGRRGEVWTPTEIELVARIGDQATRDEVAGFKSKLDGYLSPDAASEGICRRSGKPLRSPLPWHRKIPD